MTETWQTTWLKAQLLLFGVSIVGICTAAVVAQFN